MNNTGYDIYEFPGCESIVISGDIHGDFNLLVNKMCVQYRMENTLLIVAGDCGFGFENKGYYVVKSEQAHPLGDGEKPFT